MKKKTALILLAHGSRAPETLEEMEKLVVKLKRRRPDLTVKPAFLSMVKPTLNESIEQLSKHDVLKVEILPLFLFTGKHVLEDIPELIQQAQVQFPKLKITAHKAIGHHSGFVDYLLAAGGLAE